MIMAISTRISRIGLLSALLWAVSCMDDSNNGVNPPAGASDATGYFRIRLKEKIGTDQGVPTFEGKVYAGPQPSAVSWQEIGKSGACTLFKPKAVFCDPGCGSNALCVSDGVCKSFSKLISVGKITLTGAKTTDGATTITMDPILNGYQPVGTQLDFIPFTEGDPVSVSAAGDSALGKFSVSAKAISRLALLNDSIVLADGKPVQLRWTPPGKDVGSTIFVDVDISHHGGAKGKIECETADNGSLDIAASLVDALKALGVSGFPDIEVTRKSVGTHPQAHINLEIESSVARFVSIPGLISCTGDEECPTGKTCQQDLQCK
jgi:hypothetical protein